MKIYQIILIALCLTFALNCGVKIDETPDKGKCNGSLTDDEKNKGYTHCCFVRYQAEKQDEYKGCTRMNKYQFDHLIDHLKDAYYQAGTEDYNIECSSSYFKLGLLSLILILL